MSELPDGFDSWIRLMRCPHRSYLTDFATSFFCAVCDKYIVAEPIGKIHIRIAPDGSLVADADGGIDLD